MNGKNRIYGQMNSYKFSGLGLGKGTNALLQQQHIYMNFKPRIVMPRIPHYRNPLNQKSGVDQKSVR